MTDDVYLTIMIDLPRRGERSPQESVRVDTTLRTDQLIDLLCKRHQLSPRQYVLVRHVTGREHVLSPVNTLWQNGIYSDATLHLRANTTSPSNPQNSVRGPIGSGLVYLEERTKRQKFVLHWQPAIIGRKQEEQGKNALLAVDLKALDEHCKVSRHHAWITYKNNQYYVTSIHERNATYLNDNPRPLPAWREYPLQPGDRIRVGDITLVFHLVE